MKNQKYLIIFCILYILAIASISQAFTFHIENNSPIKMKYALYWVDHNIENYFSDFMLAGGEIQSHAVTYLNSEWPVGRYYIIWSDMNDEWYAEIPIEDMTSNTKIITLELNAIPGRMKVE